MTRHNVLTAVLILSLAPWTPATASNPTVRSGKITLAAHAAHTSSLTPQAANQLFSTWPPGTTSPFAISGTAARPALT